MSIYKGTELVAGSIVVPAIGDIVDAFYPVGSVYIGTTSACPLAAIKGTWELVSSGRVLQGADNDHAAGTTINAGLPNITGRTAYAIGASPYTDSVTGSFKVASGSNSKYVWAGGSTGYSNLDFDASGSNSIYGNSTTVQPPAYVVNIWKRTA